jgi:Kef-type K+ transport system membrane component KefB
VDFFQKFQTPFTDSVLILLILFVVVFSAPKILKRVRIPGIVGFILAGVCLGPHGFNIISDSTGVQMFSKFGLLYIMFLVGLEIDLLEFKKNQSKSIVFGILTFIIPLSVGFLVTYYILKLPFLGALLLSSMFSTHTLVSFPIATKLGITKNRIMSTVIGGTIITDTAVLLLLAVITRIFAGSLTLEFWIGLTGMMFIFISVMFFFVPRVSRWFFKHLEGDGSSQFLYLLIVLLGSAFLSELSGIEPMIGAFIAGLVLNSLIPPSSVLMNRTIFIGNTLFIPIFLISVGMLVDLNVLFNGYNALMIAGILVVTAEVTKYIAAYITQKLFGYNRLERNVMFGLSSSHAAATIALILVGYNMGILDVDILNGTVLVILVSCLFSGFVTENAGRKLALIESKRHIPVEIKKQRILVPIANPEYAESLINFATLVQDKRSSEPIYPLNVVVGNPDEEVSQDELREKISQLEKTTSLHTSEQTLFRLVTRIDLNVANGINRAIKELMISEIVMGWNGQLTTARNLFGSVLENILPKNNQMIFVIKINHDYSYYKRLIVIVPPNAEAEPGYKNWVQRITRISHELSVKMLIFSSGNTLNQMKQEIQHRNGQVAFVTFNDYENLNELNAHVGIHDLIFWVSAREGSISFQNYLAVLPRQLSKNFKKNSFVILYPEQHAYRHQSSTLRLDGLTQSPIKENIERISKLGKNVKKAMKIKSKN